MLKFKYLFLIYFIGVIILKGIIYYLKKFGNKSFFELPFNEIDSLILAQITYLNLDVYSNNPTEKTYIKDVVKKENKRKLVYKTMVHKMNEKLVDAIPKTTRYDNVYFKHWNNDIKFDVMKKSSDAKQFFAMTYFLDDFLFISYRGTDLTLVGWEEDFNLTYEEEVPSQKEAVKYLNNIYDKYHLPMIVAGHSKGGNLATYACAFCNSEVLDHINHIYSFDGPGFSNPNIFESPQFIKMRDKLTTVSAHISLVALMLYHVDNIEFLDTKGFLFMQHAAFNWKIDKNMKLKRCKDNSFESKLFDEMVVEVMKNVSESERKKFGEILFQIAKEKPESNLIDIKNCPIKYFKGINTRKKNLSSEAEIFYNYILRKIRLSITTVIKRKAKLEGYSIKTLKKDFRI